MIARPVLVVDDELAVKVTLQDSLKTRFGLWPSDAKSRPEDAGVQGALAKVVYFDGKGKDGRFSVDAIVDRVTRGIGKKGAEDWSLVLLDVKFGEKEGLGEAALAALGAKDPDVPVVLFSSKAQGELESDGRYLSKQAQKRWFEATLLELGRLDQADVRAILQLGSQYVVCSTGLRVAFARALRAATSELPVLILGETGSGKERLARFVHERSLRSGQLYLPRSLTDIAESLVEAELFGISDRAATSVGARPGLFESAHGGTLFLDEVSRCPLELQAKLLRVIQAKRVTRMGETRERDADARLVTATSQDLGAMVASKEFLLDLSARLQGFVITVPPLRDRREDIEPLLGMYTSLACRETGINAVSFDAGARSFLQSYSYPGNVRELGYMIRRAVAEVGENGRVGRANLVPLFGASSPPAASVPSAGAARLLEAVKPTSVARIRLGEVGAWLAAVELQKDDAALEGVVPRLEEAMRNLLRDCTGAALERTRRPLADKKLNLQAAVRLIQGDETVSGNSVTRFLNGVLGRGKSAARVSQEDAESLVEAWRERVTRVQK